MQKVNTLTPRLFVFPAVTFIAYIAMTLYLLSSGHLHEDAYILYIYAESLAQGNGIAYFPGGAPAEGATDFLWMVMLASANYLGLDVALAAGLLNGLGLGAIVLLAGQLLAPALGRHWFYPGSAVIFLVALFSQIAQASLAGFSTALYCAFVAATFCSSFIFWTRLRAIFPRCIFCICFAALSSFFFLRFFLAFLLR